MIMSNDSDLFVHNPKCILIHSFKTKKKDGSLYDIVLATSSKSQAEWIRKSLVLRFAELAELKILIKILLMFLLKKKMMLNAEV